jgi:hypothetical protein
VILAQIVTSWIGSGAQGDPYCPKVGSDYSLLSCTDVTATPAASILPSPNALVVQCLMASSVWDQLSRDPNYQNAILWSEFV